MTPILSLSGVSKRFGALRPLRIEQFVVSAGDAVAIVGPDAAGAETLTNLITGAIVPDHGRVEVFGRPTSSIVDSTDWLGVVDQFGIVTERAVLLESMDIVQNLAVPFTLDVDPPPADVRRKASDLAREAGIEEGAWRERLGPLDGLTRARVRVARALALAPVALLLEHPTASVEPSARSALAADIRAAAARRGLAVIAVTADEGFARAAGLRILRHDPASGRLRPAERGWQIWR